MPNRRAIAVAALVLLVAAAAVVIVAAPGGDDLATSAQQPQSGDTISETVRKRVARAPGHAAVPSGVLERRRRQRERFRRQIRRSCEAAGRAVPVAASASSRDRRAQMNREMDHLRRLDEQLAEVQTPTAELRWELAAYRKRLKAQMVLDRRIAEAEDSYSIDVGMRQNQVNRDARNAIVERARLPRCLTAPEAR